jgi:hypothetical protein
LRKTSAKLIVRQKHYLNLVRLPADDLTTRTPIVGDDVVTLLVLDISLINLLLDMLHYAPTFYDWGGFGENGFSALSITNVWPVSSTGRT